MTRQALAGRVLFDVYLYNRPGVARCDQPLPGIGHSLEPPL